MLPILLSSFVYSFIPEFSCLISSSSLIVSNIVLVNFFSIFSSFSLVFSNILCHISCLSIQGSFFAINLPGSSLLLNVPFFCFCLLTSSISDSAINPFHLPRYLSFSLIFYLFNILSTSHSPFPSIITGTSCSFLCPSTCPM